jgi:hypothetical protein
VDTKVYIPDMQFGVDSLDNSLVMRSGSESYQALTPTHWAFTQLCKSDMLNAPAEWLRRCSPELAAQNLNWAAQHAPKQTMKMLWANGSNPGTVRSFNNVDYARYWDENVVQWLRDFSQDETNGWHHPPARDEDVRPSGLYASDRNIFVFLVNEDYRIDDGSEKGLARGFFIWNTEVGQMSLGLHAFLYQFICGNHIVWGAHDLFTLRMWHQGTNLDIRVNKQLAGAVKGYLNSGMERDQTVISAAREKVVAPTREGAMEFVARFGFSAKQSEGLVSGTEQRGLDPTILWNLVDTGTRQSQEVPHADKRNEQDLRIGRLLESVV